MASRYHSQMMARPTFDTPLPSCNDLLNGVQPRANINHFKCPRCMVVGNDTTVDREDELCFPCQTQNQALKDTKRPPPSERENFALDAIYNRRSSIQLLGTQVNQPPSVGRQNSFISTPSPYNPALLNQATISQSYTSPTWSTNHPSPPSYPQITLPPPSFSSNNLLPRIREAPLLNKAATKAATNARHKDSEKKRRDITVSCVQTVEIFVRDLHPGIAAGCQVCIEDDAARKAVQAANPANLSGDDGRGDDLVSRMKRPKNDKLEESCMFTYLYVLHHHRELYAQRLEELAELGVEQRREQERGVTEAGTNQVKLRKWQGDQRALQTEKLLRQARELGRRHGIVVESNTDALKGTKRKRDDSDDGCKRLRTAPTPPSSVGSLLSRPSTPDSGDDKSTS